jgi:hypothetical protein
MAENVRFPIRFSSGNGVLFRGLLIRPSSAYVDLDDDTIHVRLGWAFKAPIPRRLVATAGPGGPPRIRLTAGAHGWGGKWLVNGAPDGIVKLELSERTRAFVSGFPIRLKELSVSLEDPDTFLAALGNTGHPSGIEQDAQPRMTEEP